VSLVFLESKITKLFVLFAIAIFDHLKWISQTLVMKQVLLRRSGICYAYVMKPKFYFIAAVLFPSLLDGIVTLLGQSNEYWSNFSKINEAAPITFLTYGPWIFLLSVLIYTAVLAAIIYKLPRWVSLGVGLYFFIAHSSGVESWIPYIMVEKMHISYDYWYYVSGAYELMIVILLLLGIRKWLIADFAKQKDVKKRLKKLA
jgi:hypothetical protein